MPQLPYDIIVACRTSCRDAFTKLDEEQRRGILEPPVLEISRMLEQNLFNKFRETPGMRRWLEQQRQEKLGTCSFCVGRCWVHSGRNVSVGFCLLQLPAVASLVKMLLVEDRRCT